LRPSGEDDVLQHFATVYIDGVQYRVLAPSDAVGDALEWIGHLQVRRTNPENGSDMDADHFLTILAVKSVKEELEKPRETSGDASPTEPYYHVRLFVTKDPKVEVKFDLRLAQLEERILNPRNNRQSIVLGGRTIPVQDLERIEIFKSPNTSSKFGDWTTTLAKSGTPDWYFGESDVENVTDEFITAPALAGLPQKTDVIERLCFRFHTVANQLRKRYADRDTLDVKNEYDVQDLFHALLRIFFDDVRTEEWTPSYAGKSSRMDFLLPTEKLVIETKMTREGLGAKELGTQLIEDIARYKRHPSCKRLICFAYDPERRIANPRGIESDLTENANGLEVQVIIAPRD
jgi:hypothetical protein